VESQCALLTEWARNYSHDARHLLALPAEHGGPDCEGYGGSSHLEDLRCCTKGSGQCRSPLLWLRLPCKTRLFLSGRCWVRTSDLLLVREANCVCHCSWLFRNYLQIVQMHTQDVPRCSSPFLAGWCTNWCTPTPITSPPSLASGETLGACP